MLASIAPDIHPLTNAPLLPHLVKLLKCSSCGNRHFEIHRDESTSLETQTHCVVVCETCKTCFKYEYGILEMLVDKPTGLTLAQKSNFINIVARWYQTAWRSWCMTVFCAKKCTNTIEAEKIIQWIHFEELPENPVFVDVGTSHGFYAIEIAKRLKESNSTGYIVAIDFSRKMLYEATRAAHKNLVSERIIWVLADVEECPILSDTVNIVTCGGSLNEYRNPQKAIQEAVRILKTNGSYVTMNLFVKNLFTGLFLSIIHLISGLSFYSNELWNNLFSRFGFRITQQEKSGIVMFTVSKK